MDAAHNSVMNGLFFTVGGLVALAYGVFMVALRKGRMWRVQRESGASLDQVKAWFQPTYGWLSDLLRRGIVFSLGMALVIIGAGEITEKTIGFRSGEAMLVGTILSYVLGLSLLAAPVFGALFVLLCGERIAAVNVLMSLRECGYDYTRAVRETRRLGRAGPIFSVGIRVFGLGLLGIAWFVGSTMTVNLVPPLQAWFNR
jgi:hypothetical protein